MIKLSSYILLLFFGIIPFNTIGQNNANLKFSLDSLNIGDSVTIKAKFPSCGEFGEHDEMIQIKRSEKGLFASIRKQKPCKMEAEPKSIPPKTFKSRFGPILLTVKDITIINQFFIDYKNYRIISSNGIWNATNSFTIKLPNERIYWISDMTLKWDKFTPLKNDLFDLSDKNYKR